MKKLKKIIACVLALTLFGATSVSASEVTRPQFYDVKGKVVEILDNGYVQIEDEKGETHNFIIRDNTYFITGSKEEIKAGDKVQGYYDANAPMLMIYPPQYNIMAIGVNYDSIASIKVDRFDENFLSFDKSLKLNLSKETNIIYQDGTTFDGELSELANRALVVLYTITTRSIPPQTPPDKVIILFETAIPPVLELPEGSDITLLPEPSDKSENAILLPGVEISDGVIVFTNPEINEIVVDGGIINAPTPYYNADNIPMVPLRVVGEMLGYTFSWDASTNSVLINNGEIVITVGKTTCEVEGKGSIELASAPENTNGSVFVPLQFFTKAAGLNNAYSFEGQIVISNFEKFE